MNIAYDPITGAVVEAACAAMPYRVKEGFAIAEVDRFPDGYNPNEHTLGDLIYSDGRLRLKNPDEYSIDEITLKRQQVDRGTGQEINTAVHPLAGIEEQIGILRVQIGEILNAIGLAPTTDFDNLNDIAAAKIKEAVAGKGAL